MSIPPLAGICSYADAAKPGFSVAATVQRIVRFAWVEKRTMEACLYWMNPTPEWEVKEALSLHQYLAADHATQIRQRVSEMRNPPPHMDISPDSRLDAFFEELLRAETTPEKLVGLYRVLKPALLAAYQEHRQQANPLVDSPTRRILRFFIIEEEDAIRWGEAALAAVIQTPEGPAEADAWQAHLDAYLAAAGGISGDRPVPDEALPASRATGPFTPDYMPQRDERFTLRENYYFPPHVVVHVPETPVDEVTLALMCKRALEMDVPEYMAYMIMEAEGKQPWAFYHDLGRQLWDECRHAMMGSVYFEKHGIDWRGQVALHPGFSITSNILMSPLEAHAALYYIEQGLMRGTFGGKKSEYERAIMAHDALAALFQDYDWADEVLHVHIGRRWGVERSGMSREAFIRLGDESFRRAFARFNTMYPQPEKQTDWWTPFVNEVLGHPPFSPADDVGQTHAWSKIGSG